MGNALPVQEPTMDEILASIRRIIEGHDDGKPVEAPAAVKAVSKPIEADLTAPRDEDETPVDADAVAMASPDAESSEARNEEAPASAGPVAAPPVDRGAERIRNHLRELSKPSANEIRAMNDEGRIPYGGAGLSEIEREVSSQMEEIATLSVARMRASSLEDAARATMPNGSADDAHADADRANMAFLEEFDEAAFANELLINAGLLPEPVEEPASVTRAEAVKLRLAYPESPENGSEPEAFLETAIEAVTTPAEAISEPVADAAAASETDQTSANGTEMPSVDTDAYPLLSLVSGDAETKIQASFNALIETFHENQLQRMDETVRDMLQPLLADWLEDNLPLIVERLVREEIERVARGPRRA